MKIQKSIGACFIDQKPFQTILVALFFVACHQTAYAIDSSVLEPLPVSDVYPLAGTSTCGCSVFRKDMALAPNNVILSTTAGPDRTIRTQVHIIGKTKSLKHIAYSKNKNGMATNTYVGKDIKVVNRFTPVNYHQYCDTYADAPTEGSCDTGFLEVIYRNKRESTAIMQICGC